ncbi:MAG TPA: hypothetical protein VFA28_04845 [Bryobacteraceae bacterium]|jgi:hypothetical protein|nr:hypothetical protein [Bryobacteraceae bacterium]
MRLVIVSRRSCDTRRAPAVETDIQQEIRFLQYRLEVLRNRPASPARDGHIQATLARLETLAPSPHQPLAGPVRRAA